MDTSNKHEAPPILGKSDLLGIEGETILIEFTESEDFFKECKNLLDGNLILIFHPESDPPPHWLEGYAIECDNIIKCVRSIRKMDTLPDLVIFHRIDLMDLETSKKLRGAYRKGQLSLVTKKHLKNTNLLLTSCETEYMLRELSDRFINLK